LGLGTAGAFGALLVLGINVLMLLVGASSTLLIQRSLPRRPKPGRTFVHIRLVSPEVPGSRLRFRVEAVNAMRLLVYGIVTAERFETSGAGPSYEPLRGIVEGPLAAIVSDHRGPDPEPTAAALSAFERTIRRLTERGAILPAQFGSVFADEAAVRAWLVRRPEDLLARLHRVQNAVEIGLRASWRDGGGPADGRRPQSGASYLRERHELRQRARRVAQELAPLTALARSSRRALIPRPDLPVLDAYLVDRGRLDEFVALVAQLDDRLDDVELVCTVSGPP
jgi:hypothetical protein